MFLIFFEPIPSLLRLDVVVPLEAAVGRNPPL